MAPEILLGHSYDFSSDMWSLGVIMYIILGGYPPFYEDNQAELFRKIKAGNYKFHPEFWDNVSTDAKDLISKMLVVDPAKRITAAEALAHPWIGREGRVLSQVDLGKNLVEFRKFNAKRKFKSGVHAVMAHNKLKNMMSAIRQGAADAEAGEKDKEGDQ